jgi:hypothetical protein
MLMDDTLNVVVSTGFASGDVKVMQTYDSNSSQVTFNGLKFSKMGVIKKELYFRASRLTHTFSIIFTIGDHVMRSNSFSLVSSCTQVPEDLRTSSRPRIKPKESRTEQNSNDTQQQSNYSDFAIN